MRSCMRCVVIVRAWDEAPRLQQSQRVKILAYLNNFSPDLNHACLQSVWHYTATVALSFRHDAATENMGTLDLRGGWDVCGAKQGNHRVDCQVRDQHNVRGPSRSSENCCAVPQKVSEVEFQRWVAQQEATDDMLFSVKGGPGSTAPLHANIEPVVVAPRSSNVKLEAVKQAA